MCSSPCRPNNVYTMELSQNTVDVNGMGQSKRVGGRGCDLASHDSEIAIYGDWSGVRRRGLKATFGQGPSTRLRG